MRNTYMETKTDTSLDVIDGPPVSRGVLCVSGSQLPVREQLVRSKHIRESCVGGGGLGTRGWRRDSENNVVKQCLAQSL